MDENEQTTILTRQEGNDLLDQLADAFENGDVSEEEAVQTILDKIGYL